MNNLWIREVFVDQTKGHIFSEIDSYETYTDNRGRLFRTLQKEYGRCTSRMYVDTANGTKAIGWVFEKKMAYEDVPSKFYIQEVWVELR